MVIAIIGGGLSGTLTAIHLLRNATDNIGIYLIEQDRYKMSRGIAYSSQLEFQPLNVPASAMSLFPGTPLDFYNWLKEHQHLYARYLQQPVTERDFIPRFIFGDYLKARLHEAERSVSRKANFIKIYDEAIAVKKGNYSFNIKFRDNESIEADKVVLAPGNFPPGHLPLRNSNFYNTDKYVASPWSAKGLANLPAEASVLLIGSSLTMVDLAGSLQAQGHTGKIYVLSRHGLLPQPFDLEAPTYTALNFKVSPSLSALELFRFIRKKVKLAEAQGYNWQSVPNGLRDEIPFIWQAFSEKEKQSFLRHLRPYWETHRHRMPASSALFIKDLQQQGQLEIMAGSILDMTDSGNSARVTFKRRKQMKPEEIEVYRVINCTGPQSDFTKIKTPLVTQLLEDNLIQTDDLKLGLLTTTQGMLLNSSGIQVNDFYTLGPPRKATLYESTALREIRLQAKELAHQLLQENTSFEKKYYVS